MKITDAPVGRDRLAIVRGGGDLATGVIYRLWRAGFSVLALECSRPLVVRRSVSVAQAVFDGEHTVDGMRSVLIESHRDFRRGGDVSVLVDEEASSVEILRPDILVDAIMAKKNIGTHKGMAPLVLAIGPGFTAPDEVDGVVETKRGHYLGRLITKGSPIPNTGIPGVEMGYSTERLLRAPCAGHVRAVRAIGDSVERGEVVAAVGSMEVRASVGGVLRGLIHPSVEVWEGLKIGDIDPRNEPSHCFSITDKALAVAGGIFEGLMSIKIRECTR